ncbi:MAG: hypothetical protein MAG458_01712 [Nitrosopumilus sp.]|nr:hypothetical protein [Nitrosopumilus sp.]
MFFESVWRPSIKYEIKEYGETMHTLTNNEGVILCPDCLVNKRFCKVHDALIHNFLL